MLTIEVRIEMDFLCVSLYTCFAADNWREFCPPSQVRAMDNYFSVWLVVTLNALLATLMHEIGDYDMSKEILQHWDTVRTLYAPRIVVLSLVVPALDSIHFHLPSL